MGTNRPIGGPIGPGIGWLAYGLTALLWATSLGAEEPEAAPAPDAQAVQEQQVEEVHASFEAFVKDWVGQLAQDAEDERARNRLTGPPSPLGDGLGYRLIDADYEIRVRETGRPKAPYVGILTYVEHRYACNEGEVPEDCRPVESAEITEIFPVKDGGWAY